MLEKLKEMLSKYVDDVDKITEKSRLIAEVGLSSLDMIMFFADVEDEFQTSAIEKEDMAKMVTLGDVMNFIQEQSE